MALPHSTNQTKYRPIPNFPGYEVGNDGSVWSRWVRGRRPVTLGDWYWQMKTPFDGKGYQIVCLFRGKRRYMKRVCRLVLEAFVGPSQKGEECCHKDGNPANNYLTNLRWGSRASNMADRINHGTANRGERHGRSKLSENDVRSIKILLQKGWTQKKIAAKFNVHRVLISMIKLGKVWKHLIGEE